MKRLLVPLLWLLPVTACRSAAPDRPPEPAEQIRRPPSALQGLVRALAAVDHFDRPGVTLRLRALESDSLWLQDPRRERVRVFLHLTAWAPELEDARRALEELRSELETGQGPDLGPGPVSAESLFSERDWTPVPTPNLSSYSDALRVEIDPDPPGLTPQAPRTSSVRPTTASSQTASEFVESIARDTGVAARSRRPRVHRESDGTQELRCLVTPSSPDDHETLTAIARFLQEVEAASPATRWTHIEIERALQVEEGLQPNGWTFEGELSVRTSAD